MKEERYFLITYVISDLLKRINRRHPKRFRVSGGGEERKRLKRRERKRKRFQEGFLFSFFFFLI